MNIVSISFEPLKRYAHISIDGDRISPYSDLASCESKDLHVCGMRLLKLLDEEMGSEYQLNVVGSQFQIDLLSALAEKSEFCVAVQGIVLQLAFEETEIVEFALRLNSKYSLGITQDLSISINGNMSDQVKSDSVVVTDSAEIFVVEHVPETIEKGKTILLISDHFDIRNMRGINIVEIPSTHISSFIEYYRLYTKVIPFIEMVFTHSRYSSLSKTDELLIDAYTTQTPRYIFEIAKTSLDVGETTDFQFIVLPQNASDKFQICVDRPDAVKIKDNILCPLQEGMITVSVLTQNGMTCDSKQLIVSKHSYVTSIRLVASLSSLEVGKKGQIDAYVLPENAEDAQSLKWSSSNTDVVRVTSTGEYIALKSGTAVVTVAANQCSQQVCITVYPSLEKITLTKNALTVEAGKSETIECNLFPADAAHGELIWELSNDEMGILNTDNGGKICTFTATTSLILKGNIKCRVKETEKSAFCTIEIIPEQKPIGLITCAVVFSIIGLVASFLIPMIWFGGGGIGGFFADIFLPVGIVLSLIGKMKTENKEEIFNTMLKLDLIFTGAMFFIAITCCNPG